MKNYNDLVELLKKVQATGGLDLDQASICDYQDMIGHSSIEQLEELANGNYKESFYRIYDAAYGTMETLRFYINHGEKIQAIIEECEYWQEQTKEAEEKARSNFQSFEKYLNLHSKEKARNDGLKSVIKAKDQEIIELKAKLYDLMTK